MNNRKPGAAVICVGLTIHAEIPGFSVNGSIGPNIGSFGEKGGACCISPPDKWRPCLKADVVWVVSTTSDIINFPGYEDWEKYKAWEKKSYRGEG
ncbi:DUF3304 domain-containing protein [Klebsiella oxytoca]